MTKISRIRIDSNHLGLIINNFWTAVTLLEDKEQVKLFLKDLLTHTEMKMLAKRIQIAKMLMEGYDYRAIRGFTKVTDGTIANVSNKLEFGEGLKLVVQRLKKIEKEIERERMRALPNLKRSQSSYFLLDEVVESLSKTAKKRRRRKSAKGYVSL